MVSESNVPHADDLGIPEAVYPFQGKVLDLDGLRMHYLDEGAGDPVVMLHGNPSWSLYYRKLVLALRPHYRCIVPDHIGCGLSDKPGDDQYEYTLKRRVDDVERLIDATVPDGQITLVVHDWGGMIGMAYATRHPERIRRLVVLNTSAFHLPETKPFPWALWLCRTPIGAVLVRGFNAFSSIASRVCVRRKPLPAAVRLAYVAPYNSWANRIATLRFVQDIPLRPGDRAYDIVTEVQENVGEFKDTPTLVCWGLQDFVFDEHFLALWERDFPHAEVHRFEDCGHYILEDAPDEVIDLVTEFMDKT
jgi:haloalkane dehalogenase